LLPHAEREEKKKKTEEDGRENPKGVFSVIKRNEAT